MPTFDPKILAERAIRRFKKANPARSSTANARMLRDMESIRALTIVIAWCDSQRLSVVFESRCVGGLYDTEARMISVNMKLSPEEQLHVLLHECGHHLIGRRPSKKRQGRGWHETDTQKMRTNVHRIDIVEEELEAWSSGLSLAGRLGAPVDIERYNRSRAGYIRSYLKWALRMEGV